MTDKNTKRALLMSALAILCCLSMLVGSTFAWFTDSVSTTNNIITAGNLDVELEWSTDAADWKTVTGDTNVFSNQLWEPGHTEVVYLKVKNAGTLALKYQLGVNIESETTGTNVAGNTFKLSDYIYFGVVETSTKFTNRDAAIAAVTAPAIISKGFSKSSALKRGEDACVALVVYMPTTVGNEANYKTGTAAPVINLGINLFATQVPHEEDSFGSDYDKGAPWAGGVDVSWYDPDKDEFTLTSPEELAGLAAIVNGTAVAPTTTFAATAPAPLQDTFEGKTVKLGNDLNLRGIEWTPIGCFIGSATTTFDHAFRGTFDGQGHTIGNLKVSNAGWAGVFGIVYKGTVKNLKVNTANLESNRMAGAIVGQIYGSVINCHATNVKLTVTPNAVKNGYDNGDKAGGLVGWIGDNGNNNELTNCSVDGLTARAYRDLGGIAGYVAWSTKVAGNKVANATLIGDQSVNFYGHKDYNVNAIWGRNSESSTGAGVVDGGDNTYENVEVNTVKVIADATALQNALTNGGEYTLAVDLVLDAGYSVPNGKTVVLNLNGKTVAGVNKNTATHNDLFLVKGTLTVVGGRVEMSHEGTNMGWNGCTNVFDVTAGGVLNLKGTHVENKGGTDMNFAVHMNNWGEVTLNADGAYLKATYIPVRVFNSGPDKNNVTVENSTLDGGNHSFWVHNYVSADFGGKAYSGATAAYDKAVVDARLNFDIFGNNNTFVTGKPYPVRYGFNNSIYFDINGKQVVTAPITVAPAPLKEAFLFPAGTNAVIYKDMVMTGDAQITHTDNAVLGLSNVKAELDHDVIIRKSAGAIVIENSEFTLTNDAKLISVGEGGDAYQVFMVNVKINGVLMDSTTIWDYVEGVNYISIVAEWPNA